jgi:enterochelin esterase family protein
VLQKTFTSTLLKGPRNIWIYTPPDYESDNIARPLVILFNGPMYFGSGVGPTVVDNLAAEGKIRPPVVCVIQSDPPSQLLTSRLAEAVATELVPELRSTYRISSDAKDVVIGGFSANAVWASYIALQHSNIFGNVLSQSGAFRFRLPGKLEPNSLSSMFADAPRAPVRFYIDSGLYEPVPSAQGPADESALDESNTAGNRHFRDVLRAKGYDVIYKETGGGHDQLHWRATLAEALIALLPSK